jgi:hypothetical protein
MPVKLKHNYIAINQLGEIVWIEKFPRKELAERFSGKIRKMYIDDKEGNACHIGYVVGNLWFDVFRIYNL